jgi:hypothetical protein
VRKDIAEWMRYLRNSIGFDGWRFDYVKVGAGAAPLVAASEKWGTSAARLPRFMASDRSRPRVALCTAARHSSLSPAACLRLLNAHPTALHCPPSRCAGVRRAVGGRVCERHCA